MPTVYPTAVKTPAVIATAKGAIPIPNSDHAAQPLGLAKGSLHHDMMKFHDDIE